MFVLSSGRVVTDYPYTDGIVLSFRRFEGEERDEFDKQRSKLVGRKGFPAKLGVLLQQTAARLCVGWQNVAGEDQKLLELTDANKAAFFAHPETEKYWWSPIWNYLYPSKVVPGGAETPESDRPEAEDPDFFTTR